jgi:hypothetical protein
MAGAAKHKCTRQAQYLGFASRQQERLFRAVAAAYPQPVRVTDRAWKKLADEQVESGMLACVILPSGSTYRLTPTGKAQAVESALIDA